MQFESDSQVPNDAEASDHVEAAEDAETVAVDESVAVDEALDVVAEAAEEATADDSGPSVDELEDRLRDLQGAMDKIQSGDLDAAERAIESLEQRMETTRD